MEISKPLQNLIKQLKEVSVAGKNRLFKLNAVIITPTQHIPVHLVSSFTRSARFGIDRTDDYRLTCQIQPGLYSKQVIPYRDNLKIEVIERTGLVQTVRQFRCIPLVTSDPAKQNNTTLEGNLEALDTNNLITINLQLQELGYAFLRNEFVLPSSLLMARTDKVLQSCLMLGGEQLTLKGDDAWRGVDMPEEGDNDKLYKHIEIPTGTRLMDLPTYLQTDDKYGIYSKGLGMFYRKGMFYVFPLFKMGRYKTSKRVLDIYRVAADAVPTLETSYYDNGKTLTIISTGESKNRNTADITRQNEGTGKRIINPDAVAGTAGRYYENGKAMTTRSDSLTEYKTVNRASGEEISTFTPTPTTNIYKHLSESAYNDGELITVPWDACDMSLIIPGMPCKYYYTEDNARLVEKEGVVITMVGGCVKNNMDVDPVFKESCSLVIFVVDNNEE